MTVILRLWGILTKNTASKNGKNIMNVTIEKSKAVGTVDAPPSKSVSHRALICGALSGDAIINNIAYSEDVLATLGCLESLGANVEKGTNFVKLGGLDLKSIPDDCNMFCNESGSTLRFFIPLCLLTGKKIVLSGSERLFERPLSIYENICKEQGIEFIKNSTSLSVCGKLKAGEYTVPGNISSQFITGLLFVLPMLEGDSKLIIEGKLESASYIDLTLDVMKAFGVEIKRQDNVFYIKGGQRYERKDYTVEGDCSNAAFLEAFNYLGGQVEVNGIAEDTLQGDRVYLEMYKDLKAGKKLFDITNTPDLAPVMFAMAAYFGGAEFVGTSRLKIKESDRAEVMSQELSKFGIEVKVFENSVKIENGEIKCPSSALNGHNDHRIVMALSLLCSVTGGTIEGAEAIKKSFPDYFEVIKRLGIKVN